MAVDISASMGDFGTVSSLNGFDGDLGRRTRVVESTDGNGWLRVLAELDSLPLVRAHTSMHEFVHAWLCVLAQASMHAFFMNEHQPSMGVEEVGSGELLVRFKQVVQCHFLSYEESL